MVKSITLYESRDSSPGQGNAVLDIYLDSSAEKELFVTGHNIIKVKILERSGVQLDQLFDHVFIADTQILIQDTIDESLPASL